MAYLGAALAGAIVGGGLAAALYQPLLLPAKQNLIESLQLENRQLRANLGLDERNTLGLARVALR